MFCLGRVKPLGGLDTSHGFVYYTSMNHYNAILARVKALPSDSRPIIISATSREHEWTPEEKEAVSSWEKNIVGDLFYLLEVCRSSANGSM